MRLFERDNFIKTIDKFIPFKFISILFIVIFIISFIIAGISFYNIVGFLNFYLIFYVLKVFLYIFLSLGLFFTFFILLNKLTFLNLANKYLVPLIIFSSVISIILLLCNSFQLENVTFDFWFCQLSKKIFSNGIYFALFWMMLFLYIVFGVYNVIKHTTSFFIKITNILFYMMIFVSYPLYDMLNIKINRLNFEKQTQHVNKINVILYFGKKIDLKILEKEKYIEIKDKFKKVYQILLNSNQKNSFLYSLITTDEPWKSFIRNDLVTDNYIKNFNDKLVFDKYINQVKNYNNNIFKFTKSINYVDLIKKELFFLYALTPDLIFFYFFEEAKFLKFFNTSISWIINKIAEDNLINTNKIINKFLFIDDEKMDNEKLYDNILEILRDFDILNRHQSITLFLITNLSQNNKLLFDLSKNNYNNDSLYLLSYDFIKFINQENIIRDYGYFETVNNNNLLFDIFYAERRLVCQYKNTSGVVNSLNYIVKLSDANINFLFKNEQFPQIFKLQASEDKCKDLLINKMDEILLSDVLLLGKTKLKFFFKQEYK